MGKPDFSVIKSVCGLDCSDCEYREPCACGGCIETDGQPFHGECAVAKCALGKGLRFCGECGEFPCELLQSYSSDPEHGDTPPGARIENIGRWKAQLVREAREGVDMLAACGLHCDHCPFTPYCGGCRSEYNCCSFATISPGGVCENVRCSAERGLAGCYECGDLESCEKGFYAHELGLKIDKPSAMFIKKHGRAKYIELLARKSDFDEELKLCSDTADALKLLESYTD